MDSNLVSELLSSNEGGGGSNISAPLKTYTEIFDEQFPFYLSIGMSYSQYWEDDCLLVKHYRKAYEITTERHNQELWLQGAYIYDAILRLVPVLHAFAKRGSKPEPYVSEPYAISKKQAEFREKEKEKQNYIEGRAKMESIMSSINKQFERK